MTSVMTQPDAVIERDDVLRGAPIRLIASGTGAAPAADGDRDASAQGANRFGGVAYAGNVVERWYGPMIVDIAGIEFPADHKRPVLYMHNGEERWGGGRVGVTDSIEPGPDGLSIGAFFLSEDNPRVAEVLRDARAGYPWEFSIGFDYLETSDLEAGVTETVNGREVHGPIRVVRRSRLREVSVVDIGADHNTEVAMLRKGQTMPSNTKTQTVSIDEITPEWLRANRPDLLETLASEEEEKPKDEEAEDGGGEDEGEEEDKAKDEEAEDEDGGEEEKSKDEEMHGGKGGVATLAQLKKLKGADSDFIVEALDEKLTLAHATDKLNGRLHERLQQAGKDGKFREEAEGSTPVTGAGARGARGRADRALRVTSVKAAGELWNDNESLRGHYSDGIGEKKGRAAFMRAVEATLRDEDEYTVVIPA